MAGWFLEPAYAPLKTDFGSLEAVFSLAGKRLTADTKSEVIRVEREGARYYVKRYHGTGKGWRRYALRFSPRPRVKAEWQNLKQFARWGIPTAEVVAYGLERRYGAFWRGAMITREIEGAEDLASLARRQDARLRDHAWVAHVIRQVAAHTRLLHEHHFIHNDLKWRNILVDQEGKVYFIDCPLGTYWFGPVLRYRQIKDLACLDKLARCCLSATQRLYFYRRYQGYEPLRRLDAEDKKRIQAIARFFEGRA
jgi:tRNA A-37 threonylcarbamoyl transferase component Bud32